MCIFTANKMCATLEKIFNLVYYYRNYRSKMFAGIDFTSGDTEILSKKAFKFNKTLLCVLILAAALLLAGCGGSSDTADSGDSGDVQQVSYISGGDAYYFSRGAVQHVRWEKASPEHPLLVYPKRKKVIQVLCV